MKIKLAILESDKSYLERIISVFSMKYADKLEIYSFTDQQVAMSMLDSTRIDVLIASAVFDIDINSLPRRCGFAYFVESADVSTVNDQRAICKFQKADLIYRQILSIYSEKTENISGLKLNDDSTKIILFTSVSGGTGTSSMAAACATHFSLQGKKTLYLNLEKFGSSDAFFTAEGNFDFSDIIFFLKSKKANLPLKLESCVKQDSKGVYFYSQSKIALDMLELNCDEVLRLISEIKRTGTYDYLIVDMDFTMDSDSFKILSQAHAILWVGDGSAISNGKIVSAYRAFAVLEQNADSPLTKRIQLIYNKFSNKTGMSVDGIEIKTIGGAPRYEHATTTQVVEQLAKMDVFEKIV